MEKIRVRHLSWRTEQTYRGWAWRFATFLGNRLVESATGENVGAFLTRLATAERVSAATQKQALNAVVFLLHRSEGKDLPGVWLPEALKRKWPRAGESWEWQWFRPSRERTFCPFGAT